MVKISILIPLYNGIEFLEECIDSVIHQTVTDWEILIGINGHGYDGGDVAIHTNIIANKDNRIKVIIQSPPLSGKVQSLNNLVSISSADLICILDCDDKWEPIKLERQLETLDLTAKDASVIGTFCKYFGDKSLDLILESGYINPCILENYNPIINSSSMIQKKYCIWEDNNQSFGVEDYFLWMQICLKGGRLYNIPEFLTWHRIHKTSAFNNSTQQHINAETIRKDYIEIRSRT